MKRILYTLAVIMMLCGCSAYEPDNAESVCVVKFKHSEYADYLLLPKGAERLDMPLLHYDNARIHSDGIVLFSGIDTDSMYISLDKEYFLVYPYEIMEAADNPGDYVLYDLKWTELASPDLRTDTLRILDENPIVFMDDVYPLKMHETLDDFVEYINNRILRGDI